MIDLKLTAGVLLTFAGGAILLTNSGGPPTLFLGLLVTGLGVVSRAFPHDHELHIDSLFSPTYLKLAGGGVLITIGGVLSWLPSRTGIVVGVPVILLGMGIVGEDTITAIVDIDLEFGITILIGLYLVFTFGFFVPGVGLSFVAGPAILVLELGLFIYLLSHMATQVIDTVA